MSIAHAQFCFHPPGRVISAVQVISKTRRDRLLMLLEHHGGLASLNEKLGLDRTDATLSQIKNQSPHHKTKKPRAMGDELARRIEETLGLPDGWMDTPPTYAELAGQADPMAKALAILEAMEPEARYTALRLLDAIAQPVQANGTTGRPS